MKNENYIPLNKLEVYILACELSAVGWKIYQILDWQTKKISGDQYMESTDSVGANIAEGYRRFHYLDRIKFFYNSRASLAEALHWAGILKIRGKIEECEYETFKNISIQLEIKINNFISSMYRSRDNSKL